MIPVMYLYLLFSFFFGLKFGLVVLMKRKRGSDKGTYGEAWKNVADLLRLPSLRSNTEVLQFLEDNYGGLTMRHGPGSILTLRDIFGGGPHAQARACAAWKDRQFPHMPKAAVLKMMHELRGRLLRYLHSSQRHLCPMPSPPVVDSIELRQREPLSPIPEVIGEVPHVGTEKSSAHSDVPGISSKPTFNATFLMPYLDGRPREIQRRSRSPPHPLSHWQFADLARACKCGSQKGRPECQGQDQEVVATSQRKPTIGPHHVEPGVFPKDQKM
jgi:hypothetical protein